MSQIQRIVICLTLLCSMSQMASAAAEFFAKGAYSRNNLSQDKSVYAESASGTLGIALVLTSHLKLEARVTLKEEYQNLLDVILTTGQSFTVHDIKTQTINYSAGIDIDILGEKSVFRPFIYLGAGYIQSKRTITEVTGETKREGLSGNLGLGFRIMVVKSIAIEIEGFAVGSDITKPNPPIDLYGTVGFRIFM